jgi:hypothetical protein
MTPAIRLQLRIMPSFAAPFTSWRQKVGRGLVLTQVPVGYARTEDEGMEKTPDRQIQEAITGIFHMFRVLGSVRQVLLSAITAYLILTYAFAASR